MNLLNLLKMEPQQSLFLKLPKKQKEHGVRSQQPKYKRRRKKEEEPSPKEKDGDTIITLWIVYY